MNRRTFLAAGAALSLGGPVRSSRADRAGFPEPPPLSFREATYSGVFTLYPLLGGHNRAHHGEMLGEATRLAEAGELTPRVDPRRFALAETERAYEAVADGSAASKIVVDVG